MIKNPAILLLVVFCTVASALIAQERPGRANDPLQSLADDFWQWRSRYQPFSKDDIPRIDHPAGPRDWSAASIAKQRAALREYETQWKRLDSEGWDRVQQVDYRLIGSAIARVRWEIGGGSGSFLSILTRRLPRCWRRWSNPHLSTQTGAGKLSNG
jgi:hypothetical protein